MSAEGELVVSTELDVCDFRWVVVVFLGLLEEDDLCVRETPLFECLFEGFRMVLAVTASAPETGAVQYGHTGQEGSSGFEQLAHIFLNCVWQFGHKI